jgi:hypothetical protein
MSEIVRFQCPHCGKKLQARVEYLGLTTKCFCGKTLTVAELSGGNDGTEEPNDGPCVTGVAFIAGLLTIAATAGSALATLIIRG